MNKISLLALVVLAAAGPAAAQTGGSIWDAAMNRSGELGRAHAAAQAKAAEAKAAQAPRPAASEDTLSLFMTCDGVSQLTVYRFYRGGSLTMVLEYFRTYSRGEVFSAAHAVTSSVNAPTAPVRKTEFRSLNFYLEAPIDVQDLSALAGKTVKATRGEGPDARVIDCAIR